MTLEGVVTNVAAFGAFVDVAAHQDGLVHVSAMANSFVKDPRAVAKPGDVVKVKVLSVDVPRKRISLTMRLSDPEGAVERARRERGDAKALRAVNAEVNRPAPAGRWRRPCSHSARPRGSKTPGRGLADRPARRGAISGRGTNLFKPLRRLFRATRIRPGHRDRTLQRGLADRPAPRRRAVSGRLAFGMAAADHSAIARRPGEQAASVRDAPLQPYVARSSRR